MFSIGIMVSGFISRLVILVFGTLYPAYASYKAVRTKNVKEYVKWMMYWIVFALFTCAETFTDLFLSFWFPFYYEIKIITVIYLLSPATKGSSILYRKFVHPVLTKREQEIDEYIAKAKEQGYHTMLNLGSKGVNYATSLIMQTAIKGGGGLVNQLRKSYSLSDLSEEQNRSVTDDGGHSLILRNQAQPSGRIFSGNPRDFYSPEADLFHQPVDANGEMLYPEDLAPGYSKGDPLYYNTRRSNGNVLNRTASLGPSSRTHARAVTKNGLPKRASLSEEGSTLSPLEPRESQTKTDAFNFPLSHLATYPFSLTSCQPYFISQYRHTFGNTLENQMFAFINHSQYSQGLNNRTSPFQNNVEGVFGRQADKNSDNQSLCIIEKNSNNSSKIRSEDDVSDAAVETRNDNPGNPISLASDNGKKEKLEVTENLREKASREENLFPFLSDSIDEKQQSVEKRTGKYNKKLAPTPPTEQAISKLAQNLTVQDDEPEFYTPNASPKSSRKQSISHLEMALPDKPEADLTANCNKTKSQANTTAEVSKKVKTKKGNLSVSKKLNMPKMLFSFWHQKCAKQTSNSDSCSVVSTESVPMKSSTQSKLELFIPLRDYNGSSEEAKNVKHLTPSVNRTHIIKRGINQ